MKKLIKKNQAGDVLDAATYAIPIYGTYRTYKDFYNNPNIENGIMAGLSTVGDIGTLVGAGEAINAIVAGNRARKALTSATKGFETAYNTVLKTYKTAATSAKTAKRAAGKVQSLTLQGAPVDKIIKAQRSANAGKVQAVADWEKFREASIALNGKEPVVRNTLLHTVDKSGVINVPTQRVRFTGESVPYTYKSGAEGVLHSVLNKSNPLWRNYYNSKATAVGMAPVAGGFKTTVVVDKNINNDEKEID